MKENNVVKELNEYLKGEYMGIHAYEHYIKNAQDQDIKAALQLIQQEHKQHALKIAERIQDLGGKAAEDNGFMGSVRESMMNLKGFPDTTGEILKGAVKGQQMGIRTTEDIVRGDLDPRSRQMVEENLAEDRSHIDQLNNLMY
ncbi:ferritin-like domain-containing protein [Halobacillus shinanisalinarum]|uniref:Ferritin-like domain-containing protein n=1 Tax=Halobacillus shinanisalinarum TaxID=2932258 RepID=A0ABY4GXG6_9BACI|nr:ferritin-like domain-containing protein [Halobacillus shinanisalinarum]UOQ92661.1 ferritin-like domain-containing protein [Halobacillus shinanisalinarum]